ncbi:tyrosine-type recombinase/integrase [Streptomyces luteocolor]|uniref:tyrosine-type recombinase/integrase n=1 Tax=Streptomyces luteocolor TaxID=285500 RepID=UPI000853E28E|nr:site-specific integrase [Streptomyces luteocolor]
MPGYIEDRWYTKRPDPKTGEKRKTARHGQGKRYRVAGVPGVKDRSFEKLTGAQGANAWLAKAQHESSKGEFIDPRDGNISLRRYVEADWWPEQDYADPATEATIRSRIWNHILPHLGATPLNGIKTPQLRAWLKTIKGALGDGSVHEVWGYLSVILQAAVDDERVTKNYCRSQTSVRPPGRPERKPRAWQRDRVLAVRSALPARFRVMVDLGVGAGLRQGEVLGLAVEDIDDEAEVIHVRRQVKKVGAKLVFALPKGRKTRTVPVPAYLLKAIHDHLAEFPAKKVTLPWGNPAKPASEKEAKERAPRSFELVVTAARGGAVRRDSWDTRAWKPALAAVGMIPEPAASKRPVRHRPGYSRTVLKYEESREHGFHSLRHTFASVQLDAREPIVSVSKWLGHADPSITLRIYAHMMPEADGRGRAAMQAWFDPDS